MSCWSPRWKLRIKGLKSFGQNQPKGGLSYHWQLPRVSIISSTYIPRFCRSVEIESSTCCVDKVQGMKPETAWHCKQRPRIWAVRWWKCWLSACTTGLLGQFRVMDVLAMMYSCLTVSTLVSLWFSGTRHAGFSLRTSTQKQCLWPEMLGERMLEVACCCTPVNGTLVLTRSSWSPMRPWARRQRPGRQEVVFLNVFDGLRTGPGRYINKAANDFIGWDSKCRSCCCLRSGKPGRKLFHLGL